MAEYTGFFAAPNPQSLLPLPASVRLALPEDAEKVIGRDLRSALDYARQHSTPDRDLPSSDKVAARFCPAWEYERLIVEWRADRARRESGLTANEIKNAEREYSANVAALDLVLGLVRPAIQWRVAVDRLSRDEGETQYQEILDGLQFTKVFLKGCHGANATARKQRGRPRAAVEAEITLAVARWWQEQGWALYYRPRKGGRPASVFGALLTGTIKLVTGGRGSLSPPTINSLLTEVRSQRDPSILKK